MNDREELVREIDRLRWALERQTANYHGAVIVIIGMLLFVGVLGAVFAPR